jgi:hypothetical protein
MASSRNNSSIPFRHPRRNTNRARILLQQRSVAQYTSLQISGGIRSTLIAQACNIAGLAGTVVACPIIKKETYMKKELAVVLLSVVSAVASAAAPKTTTVTFSNGTEGWAGVGDGQGGSWIDSTSGKNSSYHSQIYETFGLNWVNKTNQAFVANYGAARSITLGIDLKANSVTYDGIPVSRHLVVELRDHHNPYGNMPYTSVWYDLGEFSADKPGWQHMSVTIPDTTSTKLPHGWGGYGDGGVALPPGRTFADVLSQIDEVAFTTFVPGYAYGYTTFDVEVDNISIKAFGKQ